MGCSKSICTLIFVLYCCNYFTLTASSVTLTGTPTSAPTESPTSAPTPTCRFAKYKGTMRVNDALWSGESLVSPNCRYLLLLNSTGNLHLLVYTTASLSSSNSDYDVWRTDNTMASSSNVAKFYIENGQLHIDELSEMNANPNAGALSLWQNEQTPFNGDDATLILVMLNDGCLALFDYVTKSNRWAVCVTIVVQNATNSTSGDQYSNVVYVNNTQVTTTRSPFGSAAETTTRLWWLWLFFGVILVLILVLYACRHRILQPSSQSQQNPSQPWVNVSTKNVTKPYRWTIGVKGDIQYHYSEENTAVQHQLVTNAVDIEEEENHKNTDEQQVKHWYKEYRKSGITAASKQENAIPLVMMTKKESVSVDNHDDDDGDDDDDEAVDFLRRMRNKRGKGGGDEEDDETVTDPLTDKQQQRESSVSDDGSKSDLDTVDKVDVDVDDLL